MTQPPELPPAPVSLGADQPADWEEFRFHLPDALIEAGVPDGVVTYLNAMARNLLGYDGEDIRRGFSGYALLDADGQRVVAESVAAHLEASVLQGKPYRRTNTQDLYRVNFRRKDGTYFPAEVQGSYVLDPAGYPKAVRFMFRDITDRVRIESLLEGQTALLEKIAHGDEIEAVLEGLCLLVEQQLPGASCSVLALDDVAGTLRHVAAPSLPASYVRAIDGVAIGPSVGSCGTAAFLNQPVFVADVASDPKWVDFVAAAEAAEFRACWSLPIAYRDGAVAGTFAVYMDKVASPNPDAVKLLNVAAHLASVAFERRRTDERRQTLESQVRTAQELENVGLRQLAESRERVELAVRGAEFAVWDLDMKSGAFVLDGRIEEITGRPLRGSIPYSEWEALIHPEDLPPLREVRDAMLRTPSEAQDCEFRIRHASGDWIWLRTRGRVVERDRFGRATRAAGQYLDVTERKAADLALVRSEAQLRAMFEGSRELIMIVAPDGEILRVNREYVRTRSAAGPYEAGRNLFEYLGDRGEEVAGYLAEALAGGVVTKEWTAMGAEGEEWLQVSFSPVAAPDGSASAVALLVRDMTDRMRSEQALAQVQKLDSLGRLVGGVAHDFNNLLGVILGYAEFGARRHGIDSEARADFEGIMAAAGSAAELTRQLLAFARREVVEARDVDLNDQIRSAEKLLRRALGERVNLRCLLAADPLVAQIDPGQFEQVIVNLAINARDAMTTGGTVTIRTRPWGSGRAGLPPNLPERGYAVVEVSDTGCGMDRQTAERIFEPFFTTKELGKGTGLGLSTCYGIIAQAGGHIGVQSEVGRGTTFTIHLPAGSGAAEPALGGRTGVVPSRHTPGREAILLVEDNAELRVLLTRMLRHAGYSVLPAENPARALETAATGQRVDLILSDIVMPMMDGVALSEVLVASLGAKPVVFMSGFADEALVARATGQGARFIRKPFEPSILAAIIRATLDEANEAAAAAA